MFGTLGGPGGTTQSLILIKTLHVSHWASFAMVSSCYPALRLSSSFPPHTAIRLVRIDENSDNNHQHSVASASEPLAPWNVRFPTVVTGSYVPSTILLVEGLLQILLTTGFNQNTFQGIQGFIALCF